MSNFYLQRKAIERNKFLKFLICTVFVLFSAFLLYSFISCVNDINTPSLYLLGNTLSTLPYLIIFFVFFTFQCCYELNLYYEPICITKNNMSSVCKNEVKAVFLYGFSMFIEAFVLNAVYIIVNKQFNFALIFHTLEVLVLYFLLCILSSVFIGFLLSLIRQKIVSYTIMIIIALSETDLMDSFSVGIYNSFDIDITKLLKLFNIVPHGMGWTPNMHSGYMITLDKLSQIMFFIFLSLFVYYLSFKNNFSLSKRKFKIAICFSLCVITIVGYILPFSAPQMDLSASGVSSDKRYYENHPQLSEIADFKVENYDIKLKFDNKLNAVATIKINDNSINKYKFTLYHGYKVSKITDINDKNLNFIRNSDYLTIDNSTKSEYINIYYSGSCSKYYSNYSAVFLPGNFAYYPIPGFNEVYSTSSYCGFNDLSLPYEVDFKVKVNTIRTTYCNLNQIIENEFQGKSNSLTLISGYINCVKINETDIYYPYFDDLFNVNYISDKLSSFVLNNPNIKKIIIIPNINLEDIEFAKTYKDYMITATINDIERVEFLSKIDAHKLELYYTVNAYLNQKEYFEFLKEHSNSEEVKAAIPLIEEILQDNNNDENLEQINQYLIDKTDKRSFYKFLYELR